jgi:glycosyltransferase involved in cell wall biosynthesis
MRILVCRPQVPFVRGGVEIFTDTLVAQLVARGHEAELVTLPWVTWPNEKMATNALMWRLLDLGPDMQPPPDLVIATKFPSYLIRHPNKVVWLVHQLRQAYELHGTTLGQFSDSRGDSTIREGIHDLDRLALGEARRVFATSANVASRLRDTIGLEAEVLPHPPQELPYESAGYGDFVLSVGRLDPAKRLELLLEAIRLDGSLKVVIAGDGPDRARLEGLASELSPDRVRFTGRVSEPELVQLYATCRAVYYAPVDEDFGMVPFEAFRAARPVVTTSDAGGPLEIVRDRETGRVVEPVPAAIATALRELLADEPTARRLGETGQAATAGLGWDAAIGRLLG